MREELAGLDGGSVLEVDGDRWQTDGGETVYHRAEEGSLVPWRAVGTSSHQG